MNSNTTYSRDLKVTARKTDTINVNCPVPFVQRSDRRAQNTLINIPIELYYNPSTKTLHCDSFSGGIPSLLEGEGIQLTTYNNKTTINVNFDRNTSSVTALTNNDTILLQDGLDFLKTIRADPLKTELKPTEGTNLSYGTDIHFLY